MKITLIGSGYVGRCILENWENTSDQFVVSTTTKEKTSSLKLFPLVDQVIFNQMDLAIENSDGVIICIAPKKLNSYNDTYLKTAQILQKLLQARIKPLYLLYTSSTSIYGRQKQKWVDETTLPLHLSSRGKVLYQTEKLYLSMARQGIEVCILRLGGIFGPGRTLQARAQKVSNIKIPGSGSESTNHSHLQDIVRAIAFCFRQNLQGVYNVVNDPHPTRKALYEMLCKQQGIPPPQWDPDQIPEHGCHSCVSNQKIKQAGFTFIHSSLLETF